MYLVFSKKIKKIPYLENFLGDKVIFYKENYDLNEIKGVVGWGLKETTKKARSFAKKHNLPFYSLEDGFVCSHGLRVKDYPPLSLIIDPVGIYYDATKPSLLENLLNTDEWITNELLSQAEIAIELLIKYNISKYNHAKDADESLLRGKRDKRILLIDQTMNDLSVVYGGADEHTFRKMYQEAREENPDADIYIKIHPDVIAGKKRGYLASFVKEKEGTYLVTEDVNSISLIKFFDVVYTVTSLAGFEALLLGKKVKCFGMPFYAGWGLTEDRGIKCERRNKKRSLLEIFAAAYLKYCRYINPKTGQPGTIFDVIDFILKQKEIRKKFNKFCLYFVDFHIVKRSQISEIFKGNNFSFVNSKDLKSKRLPENSILITWGYRKKKELERLINGAYPIWCMEDGFIRSVGLGAEFVPPMSFVIDKRGIYYNSQEESELEWILNNYEFSEKELEEAERIRKVIIKYDVTKYNVDYLKDLEKTVFDKKIIFVPGQVEGDESILFGSPKIKTNLELLQRVRANNPDAYIIYKPHPDVLAKLRRKEEAFQKIKKLCDRIVTDVSVLSCIKLADEVHTLTSLSGFEALLREKTVVTYGIPFYAGWGLTIDNEKILRRYRKLTLSELVAGTLLVYPFYYDWVLKGFVDCETVINRIIQQKKRKKINTETYIPFFLKKLTVWIKALKELEWKL